MKKSIITTVIAITMAAPVWASVNIGYTNESLGRNNTFRLGSSSDQRIALRIPHEKLALMKGKTVSGVRAVFGSKNSTNKEATLFLTTSLDGEAITSKTVDISSTTGFLEFTLDAPYTITGDEAELFVGYKLEIGASYGAFSSDFSSDNKGLAFAYGAGGWQDLYGKGYGMPNIELVVDGADSFTDATLKSFSVEGYNKVGQAFAKEVEIYNFGTETITSFDLVATIGNDIYKQTLTELNIAPHGTYKATISSVLSTEEGSKEIAITLNNVNGTDDADISDNSDTSVAYFYPSDCQKNILVEMFTGQTCSNCAAGHTSMANEIVQTGASVVEVVHHAGYVSDIFSMTEDWDITSLYNGGEYAPAAMVNRTITDSGTSPVFDPWSTSTDVKRLQAMENVKPYVTINLDTNFDTSTREVTLIAKVKTCEDMPGGDIRYSIWLVQDSIIASQSSAGANYVHNATSRGCLTESVWGDKAEFISGETLEIEKTLVLPDTIVSTSYTKTDGKNHLAVVDRNMKIVFFVNQYSSTDINSCKVFNAAECPVIKTVDGIADTNENDYEGTARKCIIDGRLVIIKNNQTFRIDGLKLPNQ